MRLTNVPYRDAGARDRHRSLPCLLASRRRRAARLRRRSCDPRQRPQIRRGGLQLRRRAHHGLDAHERTPQCGLRRCGLGLSLLPSSLSGCSLPNRVLPRDISRRGFCQQLLQRRRRRGLRVRVVQPGAAWPC